MVPSVFRWYVREANFTHTENHSPGKLYLRFQGGVKPIAILSNMNGFGLTKQETAVLWKLSTPAKIQDFLNALPTNFEKKGDTLYSPRLVLRYKKAHCIEGALLAAAALWIHDEEPLLMDLMPPAYDEAHVIALYRRRGYWGALSKTNHGVLRYRDPVYRTPRELALSYFHEFIMNKNGKKTLETYSAPFNLKRLGMKWVTDEGDMSYVNDALDAARHFPVVPKANRRLIRRADPVEIEVGSVIEWKETDPRT